MNKNEIYNRAYIIIYMVITLAWTFGRNWKISSEKYKNTKFYLYKKLCELVYNSQVTKEASSFIVEIDSEENRNLVDNMKRSFLIRVLKRARPNKNKGRHMEVGNVFFKIKIFK